MALNILAPLISLSVRVGSGARSWPTPCGTFSGRREGIRIHGKENVKVIVEKTKLPVCMALVLAAIWATGEPGLPYDAALALQILCLAGMVSGKLAAPPRRRSARKGFYCRFTVKGLGNCGLRSTTGSKQSTKRNWVRSWAIWVLVTTQSEAFEGVSDKTLRTVVPRQAPWANAVTSEAIWVGDDYGVARSRLADSADRLPVQVSWRSSSLLLPRQMEESDGPSQEADHITNRRLRGSNSRRSGSDGGTVDSVSRQAGGPGAWGEKWPEG